MQDVILFFLSIFFFGGGGISTVVIFKEKYFFLNLTQGELVYYILHVLSSFFTGINVLIQTSVAYWPDNWGRCEGSVVFVRRVARRRMMMWDTAAASVRDHCGWFQKGRHHCLAWSQLCFLILLNHCHTVKNKHTIVVDIYIMYIDYKKLKIEYVVDIYQQHIMAI